MPKKVHQGFVDAVDRYWDDGVRSAKKMLDLMDDDTELAPAWATGEESPSEKWVRNKIKALKALDPSGAWSPAGELEGSEEFILGTLKEVIRHTGGRLRVTVQEARILHRLHLAAPDLEEWAAFKLAQRYIKRKAQELGTDDLDTMVAFAGWRSDKAMDAWLEAGNAGWIPFGLVVPKIGDYPDWWSPEEAYAAELTDLAYTAKAGREWRDAAEEENHG